MKAVTALVLVVMSVIGVGSLADLTQNRPDPVVDGSSTVVTFDVGTRDYSGTFTRQERIDGKLSAEQVGEMKMRVNPVGVHVRFARPEATELVLRSGA